MTQAGGGARREYERRRARDRERMRAGLPYIVGALVLVGPVSYGLSRAGLPKFWKDLLKTSLPSTQAHEISLWIAVIAFLSLATELTRRKTTTHAFRVGAEGEERVGAVLDTLEPRGCRVIHDVSLRGYGNIDHVVVGPGGIFTIETKNAGGEVRIRSGVIRENGRRRDEHLSQARKQVEAVRQKLISHLGETTLPVSPLLCYARARVDVGWFSSNIVDGVRVVTPLGLRRTLEGTTPVLDDDQIEQIAGILTSSRKPAAAVVEAASSPTPAEVPRCSCGSERVLRRRKSDGTPFYGCTRFPACRGTRPAG